MRKMLKNVVRKQLEGYVVRLLEIHKPKVIAITGSVGKTSTKLATAHLLKDQYNVLVHKGNYNTEFGLPLSLFELETPAKASDAKAWMKIFAEMRRKLKEDYPYDIVVLEMGADSPGDIKHFMEYIHPDIGVVTAVAKVHMEEFKTAEAILDEKWSLAHGSRKVFYNHDDKRLRDASHDLDDAQGYGLDRTDNWADLKQFRGVDGWSAKLHLGSTSFDIDIPVVARQSVYALVLAAAIANDLGLSEEQIKTGIDSWPQPHGRMQLLKGKNDSLILDDSYNANPYATVAALDALTHFEGRKLAILGTMNELGDYETAGHRLVGKHAKDLDLLVTIGDVAELYLSPAAVEAGLSPKKVRNFSSPYEAGKYVAGQLQPEDNVLVKGSQNGVFAEEAIKYLLDDSSDKSKLVRQSPEWMEKKHEQFPQTADKQV